MAVPMASLQRAAQNPLARTAGTPTSAMTAGNPGAPPNPSAGLFAPPNGPPTVPSPQAAPPAQAPAPVMMDPYGVVPRPPAPPASPAPHLPTQAEIQARADEETRKLAAQRAADVAAGRRPAEVSYQDQVAEEQRKSSEFQMQRAAELERVRVQGLEDARVKRLADEARQRELAAEAQRKNDEERAFRTELTRTPEVGAVNRTEGTLDAGASREDLSALIDLARTKGLIGPAAGGSGALGSLQAAATPARVVHAPATVNTTAAFSRAKDRVGQISRGALDSLQRAMSGRGLSGSSIEGRGISQAVEQGAGALADTARTQAEDEATRANAVDDQTYQGDLSQRSADIAAGENARNFNLQATNSGFSNLQGLMALVRRGRPVY